MRQIFTSSLVLLCLCFNAASVYAQADGAGAGAGADDAQYELGFHLGNLLPNQIAGVTEIMGLGGVRAGVRLAPLTYAEAGFIMGNGHDAQWKNAHIDARMDIPVENLVGLAYVGGDTIYYKGKGTSTRVIFGGHAGGGLRVQMSGSVWFRGDMKFGFSPGTSLYVGCGFEYRATGK